MRIKDFPYCCTAKIIVDFGGTETSEGDIGEIPEDVLLAQFCKQAVYFGSRIGRSTAILTAITNNEQKVANDLLKKIGFKSSKWMSKEQHPETKIKLWYIERSKFVEYFS